MGFVTVGFIAQWLFTRFVNRMQDKADKQDVPELQIVNKSWLLFIGLLLFSSFTPVDKNNNTAYLVTVTHRSASNKQRFKVYRFTDTQQVDSLVAWNFGHGLQIFNTKKILEHSHHFQILTDDCTIYCEEKEISGYKKNGQPKLKKLK